jgi:hypothetical protein
MHPSRCGRLTREIGLVLISSSLILCGCRVHPDDEEEKKKKGSSDQSVFRLM